MQDIDVIRRFNRLYTARLGVLNGTYLNSSFSLAEIRVLHEIATRDKPNASAIARDLRMDCGYLSRMLADFTRRKLIKKTPAKDDKRRSYVELTDKGQAQFAELDSEQRANTGSLLSSFSPQQRATLLRAMREVTGLLEHKASRAPVVFRPPRNGDLGWIVHRHGAGIAEEFGFDQRFEALCGRIIGEFAANYDAERDHCWVADHGGEVVGSIFLMKDNPSTGRIRLLYVEPHMRGQRIGQRLVERAIRHARKVGYRKLVLFTNQGLEAAHHIYEKAGFSKTHEKPHDLFGENQTGQEWEFAL